MKAKNPNLRNMKTTKILTAADGSKMIEEYIFDNNGNVTSSLTIDESLWEKYKETNDKSIFINKKLCYSDAYTYDDKGNLLTYTDHVNGSTTEWEYDDKGHKVLMKVDGKIIKTYENDEIGNPVVIKIAGGTIIRSEFDNNGITHQNYTSDGITYDTYYQNGEIISSKTSKGDWQEFTYDDKGNLLASKSSVGEWRVNTYDDKGNLLSEDSSARGKTIYTYDESGKKVKSENLVESIITNFIYNDSGLLLMTTDGITTVEYKYEFLN